MNKTKFFKKIVLLFLLQCVVAGVFYIIIWNGYSLLYNSPKRDISWGITLHFSKYLFSALALLLSILLTCKVNKALSLVLTYSPFLIIYFPVHSESPYKLTLLLASTFLAMVTATLIATKLYEKEKDK